MRNRFTFALVIAIVTLFTLVAENHNRLVSIGASRLSTSSSNFSEVIPTEPLTPALAVSPISGLQCPVGTCAVGGYTFGATWKHGKCPANGPFKKHTGADLRANKDDPVVAAETGVIKRIYSAGDVWGMAILVEHTTSNSKFVTQYMHVTPNPDLKEGSGVTRGQPIAKVADIAEPHLHFGVWNGPAGPTATQRGALPACEGSATSCDDGKRTDPCFPQLWIDPSNLFGNSVSASRPFVSSSLQISQDGFSAPGPFELQRTMRGTFSITNRGNADLNMRQLVIAGQISGEPCSRGGCPYFSPIYANRILRSGQTIVYQGNFNPPREGTYTFWVAYEKQDRTWVSPVSAEKGAINQLDVIVRKGKGPVLLTSSPTFLNASPYKQTLMLFGRDLDKTLYCRLILPSGKTKNIYVPLKQVTNGPSDRLQIDTEFPWRGKYQIIAHKLTRKSNTFVIEVR
ncbi:MAG TPA: M23 family metallopeptidase [Pyrinomonadaceae bacterium]|nr:M23 family metallopeptidase [Pyrinomonadaceae bacterium]